MPNLGQFLNQLQKEFHRSRYLASDPLEFVHRYRDPWDQEAVALLSSVLAYGKVAQIQNSVEDALKRMNRVSQSPSDFVRKLHHPTHRKKAEVAFQGHVHRFNQGADIVLLFVGLNQSWTKYGSLGSHLLHYLSPLDSDTGNAMSQLISDWRKQLASQETSTFSYLLTSPQDGSCCKRWCMLLRWMGRKDQLDLGLWSKQSPLSSTFPSGRYLKASQLVMPLDTHTGRISQYLGLTQRKTLNWKAAIEVTQSLKAIDPEDPTRFDFALARLGILDICQKKYRREICQKCQLLPVCNFAQTSLNRKKETILWPLQ
jgi:uncharacterized protein (TIGR02757 family)